MEMWLNDTTVDGFLGNLRDYENFIVTDAKWNATKTTSSSRPPETTIVTDAVGLLNYYEYRTCGGGVNGSTSYLNNGLWWWTLTANSANTMYIARYSGTMSTAYGLNSAYSVRPSMNLKSNVQITSGTGTKDDPFQITLK